MHIQKFFVIFAFNENLINTAVVYLSKVPGVGAKLEGPIRELLAQQKEKLHRKSDDAGTSGDGNVLSWIFEKFVILMVIYFVLSIVNSLAQSYHKRIHKKHAAKEEAEKID